MNNFESAYAKTMGHEGGYSNDPDDVGGETYKGISRVYNPKWEGWKTIDFVKLQDVGFPKGLKGNEKLERMVKSFYKDKYWDAYVGDEMPFELALEMFDTAVNMGVHRVVKYLQIALNVMNRNGKLYPDMPEDGKYGPTTHTHLKTYYKNDNTGYLVKIINILQGMHYINYMKKSPTQEKYARGWFNRVSIEK